MEKVDKRRSIYELDEIYKYKSLIERTDRDVIKEVIYDNDEESRRVFHENIEKNGQTKILWQEQWSTQLQNQVDLTLANIIDGVLLDLKPEFQAVNSKSVRKGESFS